MSDSYVNQITLNYLINKDLLNKHYNNQVNKTNNMAEYLKYKQEIIDLTLELLESSIEDKEIDIFPDVKFTFDNYIKTSIQHFKNKEYINEINSNDNLDEFEEFEKSEESKESEEFEENINDNKDEENKDEYDISLTVKKIPHFTFENFMKVQSKIQNRKYNK
jgi:hypothetical protein